MAASSVSTRSSSAAPVIRVLRYELARERRGEDGATNGARGSPCFVYLVVEMVMERQLVIEPLGDGRLLSLVGNRHWKLAEITNVHSF